jgi:hypothetical protein
MGATITHDLDLALNTVRTWLTPTVDSQCGQPDAVKLRILRRNIEEIRERVAFIEGGELPEGYSLAATIEAVAELFARHARDGVQLQTDAVVGIVGLLNEAAAWAWTYEQFFRAATGKPLPDDLAVLRLAKVLVNRGVTAGMPDQPTGGDAA